MQMIHTNDQERAVISFLGSVAESDSYFFEVSLGLATYFLTYICINNNKKKLRSGLRVPYYHMKAHE